MKIIETKVFEFDELSESAKENARNWYREGDDFSIYADSVIDDAKEIGRLMGIDIKTVYYSGFSSQGDGACFEGYYSYITGCTKAVKEYAPRDKKLQEVVSQLAEIQRRNFYKLSANVKHKGHYYHDQCTAIEVLRGREYFFDTDDSYVRDSTHDGAALILALRDFMKWIYCQLQEQYYWINEDKQVDENIKANEYTFTEEGKRYG